MSNYYKTLGLKRDASEKEIRRAYYKLARELHPDKADSPDKQLENEQKLAVVSEAYNTLKDPLRRKEYDKSQGNTDSADNSPPSAAGKAPSIAPSQTAGAATAADQQTSTRRYVQDSPEVTEQKAGIAKRAFQKGMVMFKQKDYARAIEFFEAAIKNDPNSAEYHSNLAHASLLAKKGFSKAIVCCEEAIRLDPYNVEHKIIMARIYETVGSTSNAERVYQDVLRWDPQNLTATRRLAELQGGDKNEKSFFMGLIKKFKKR